MYHALNYFKHAPDYRRVELRRNIEKAFNKKHSNQIFKIAINVFNDKLFTLLNQSGFMNGERTSAIINDSKILYSYSSDSQIGILEIEDKDKIQFEKDRALMLDFLYKARNRDSGSGYRTYKDFNERHGMIFQ